LKTKVNPGLLHGHSASKVMGSMIIFGGKKGGQISNDLWKFYFGNNSYSILSLVFRIEQIVGNEYETIKTIKTILNCFLCLFCYIT